MLHIRTQSVNKENILTKGKKITEFQTKFWK